MDDGNGTHTFDGKIGIFRRWIMTAKCLDVCTALECYVNILYYTFVMGSVPRGPVQQWMAGVTEKLAVHFSAVQ